jgi:C4-type Zn-finger protein
VQELSYGTLGGVYTTVEGLLQKIDANLRCASTTTPFRHNISFAAHSKHYKDD